MTGCAGVRKSCSRMIRIGCRRVVVCMAGEAIRGSAGVFAADMAVGAGDRRMGSGQRERGGAVVERGWSPCAHTVAAGAVL
jgi:hypothetical protein